MKEYGRQGKGVPVVNFLISGKLTGKNDFSIKRLRFNPFRRKRPKVDASILDSALSHTRCSGSSKKRRK